MGMQIQRVTSSKRIPKAKETLFRLKYRVFMITEETFARSNEDKELLTKKTKLQLNIK